MKRGRLTVILTAILIISIVFVSLVSASWFSDLFNGITGKAVEDKECADSDNSVPDTPNHPSHYIKGIVTYNSNTYEDICVDLPSPGYVQEYECDSVEDKLVENEYKCPNGCKDGACINLIAHYKLDNEDASTDINKAEDDMLGNDGIFYGATAGNTNLWGAGKINNAAIFDGVDNYIEIPDSSANSPTGKITVSGWFKFDKFTNAGLIWKGYNYALWSTSSIITFGVWNVSGNYSRASFNVDLLKNGEWNHIVGVFNGKKSFIYLNGRRVGTIGENLSGGIKDKAGNLWIGRRQGGNSSLGFFDGAIDDVKIWNKALTSAEIKAEYEAIVPPKCTDSDSGFKYYNIKGTTCFVDDCKEDECYDSSKLTEYYCNISDDRRSTRYTCPLGCNDGACIEATEVDGCSGLSNAVKRKVSELLYIDKTVILKEGEKAHTKDYIILGDVTGGKLGKIVKVRDIYNSSYGYENDLVRLEDSISGNVYEATITSEGKGNVVINSITYNIEYGTDYDVDYSGYELIEWIEDNEYVIVTWAPLVDDATFNCEWPVLSQACSVLINTTKNPKSFTYKKVNYTLNHNFTYDGSLYINGKYYDATTYYASWHTYSDNYNYINYEITVAADKKANLSEWLEKQISWNWHICKATTYYASNGKENKVYICNWDVMTNEQNIDNYQYKSRQIFWVNANVAVRIDTYTGEDISDEELIEIMEMGAIEFLDNLKNNEYEGVDWSDFDISSPLSDNIGLSLGRCPSKIPATACSACWSCKTEPVVCPPHGYQTKICIDKCCDSPNKEEQEYCSPGICSGCYVPRWFGFEQNSRDNVCIPYGTRLAYTNAGNKEKAWMSEINEILEDIKEDEGINITMEITPNNALHIVFESEYPSVEFIVNGMKRGFAGDEEYVYAGNNYDIEISEGGRTEKFSLFINNVHYSESISEQYFELTFQENFNAYCNYNGRIYQQKDKSYDRSWAKCQNNYECESNLCLHGECYDIESMLAQTSSIKGLGIKIICRLAGLFRIEQYDSCLANYLG